MHTRNYSRGIWLIATVEHWQFQSNPNQKTYRKLSHLNALCCFTIRGFSLYGYFFVFLIFVMCRSVCYQFAYRLCYHKNSDKDMIRYIQMCTQHMCIRTYVYVIHNNNMFYRWRSPLFYTQFAYIYDDWGVNLCDNQIGNHLAHFYIFCVFVFCIPLLVIWTARQTRTGEIVTLAE